MNELLVREVVKEISQVESRVRHRESTTGPLMDRFGPKVGKYLRQSSDLLLSRLLKLAIDFNTQRPVEFYAKTESREAELPEPLALSLDDILASSLGIAQENILRSSSLALVAGYKAGWEYGFLELSRMGLKATDPFNVRNKGAIEWAGKNVAELVTRVNDTTRGEMRKLITAGFTKGDSYQTIARAIRKQFSGDSSYSGPPLTGGPRHIRTRADLIAVTEIGNAYEEGTKEVMGRANETSPMEKRWLTVGDSRVSADCQGNGSQGWIPFASNFSSGAPRPLNHPGCRCTVLYRTA